VTEVVEASGLIEVVVAVLKLGKQEGVEIGRGNYGTRISIYYNWLSTYISLCC